jgi:hypothetical protein
VLVAKLVEKELSAGRVANSISLRASSSAAARVQFEVTEQGSLSQDGMVMIVSRKIFICRTG